MAQEGLLVTRTSSLFYVHSGLNICIRLATKSMSCDHVTKTNAFLLYHNIVKTSMNLVCKMLQNTGTPSDHLLKLPRTSMRLQIIAHISTNKEWQFAESRAARRPHIEA